MLDDKELLKYVKGFSEDDGRYIVVVRFKEKWQPFTNNDGVIESMRDPNDPTLCYYSGDVDKVELSAIYEMISQVVKINIEAEEKMDLLMQKIEEMKRIFSETPLEKLRCFTFTFADQPVPVNKAVSTEKPKIPSINEAKKMLPLDETTDEAANPSKQSPFRKAAANSKIGRKKAGTPKPMNVNAMPTMSAQHQMPAGQPQQAPRVPGLLSSEDVDKLAEMGY